MLLKTAESYFGSCRAIADQLSSSEMRTLQAVYSWKKKGVVPLAAARQIESLTKGKVKVDPTRYDQYGRVIPVVPSKKLS